MFGAIRHHDLRFRPDCAASLYCLPLLLFFGAGGAAADENAAPTAEQVKFFESSVRPILVQHCQKCHSGDKPKGEMSLESRAGLIAGGVSGAVVSLGKQDRSEEH